MQLIEISIPDNAVCSPITQFLVADSKTLVKTDIKPGLQSVTVCGLHVTIFSLDQDTGRVEIQDYLVPCLELTFSW